MPRLLLTLQLWFCMFLVVVACDKGNFKAPMALETGYLFPGAATLMANEDGTYVLTWPIPPTEGTLFRIYKRTAPESFDFSKPIAQTDKQIYVSEDLRFAPKTCFVVRFTIADYECDKNTKCLRPVTKNLSDRLVRIKYIDESKEEKFLLYEGSLLLLSSSLLVFPVAI